MASEVEFSFASEFTLLGENDASSSQQGLSGSVLSFVKGRGLTDLLKSQQPDELSHEL